MPETPRYRVADDGSYTMTEAAVADAAEHIIHDWLNGFPGALMCDHIFASLTLAEGYEDHTVRALARNPLYRQEIRRIQTEIIAAIREARQDQSTQGRTRPGKEGSIMSDTGRRQLRDTITNALPMPCDGYSAEETADQLMPVIRRAQADAWLRGWAAGILAHHTGTAGIEPATPYSGGRHAATPTFYGTGDPRAIWRRP